MPQPDTLLQEVRVQLLPERNWWATKQIEGTIRCRCGRKTTVQGPLKCVQNCPPIFCQTCGQLLTAVCVVEDAAAALIAEIRQTGERN